MILRLIRARAGTEQVVALCRALDQGPGTAAHEPRGLVRYHLGSRPGADGDEILLLSFWTTFEAAAEADKRGTSPLAIAQGHLGAEMIAAHYEIDETILRHSDEDPVALRVGKGTFSKPGADIEMLELLRQRAPIMGDEMAEAYVGRRLAGRAIEVVFVSAWSKVPEGVDLELALWPDIALRYDSFGVEVYGAVQLPPD